MRTLANLAKFSALTTCLLALGCGESWQVDTYPATGRLSVNGRPATGALVQLFPAEETDERNSRPWGLVGADGSFTLSTYEGRPGAPAGDYALTVTWPPDPGVPSMLDKLKGRYATPDRAAAKVSIKAEANTLPPVDLTGVDVDPLAGARSRNAASPTPPMMAPEPTSKKRGR